MDKLWEPYHGEWAFYTLDSLYGGPAGKRRRAGDLSLDGQKKQCRHFGVAQKWRAGHERYRGTWNMEQAQVSIYDTIHFE